VLPDRRSEDIKERFMSNQSFWYFLQFGTGVLCVVSIPSGYWLFPGMNLCAGSICAGLVVLLKAEINIVRKIGREKNILLLRVVVKTLLFGFTWWLPLKKKERCFIG
jgi:hypothetical protein